MAAMKRAAETDIDIAQSVAGRDAPEEHVKRRAEAAPAAVMRRSVRHTVAIRAVSQLTATVRGIERKKASHANRLREEAFEQTGRASL